nr:MAG TPA: hypothetical protein [Caudoviricetes sp.]
MFKCYTRTSCTRFLLCNNTCCCCRRSSSCRNS